MMTAQLHVRPYRRAVFAAAGLLAVVLTACGSSSSGSTGAAPTTSTRSSTTGAPTMLSFVPQLRFHLGPDFGGIARQTDDDGAPCFPVTDGALSYMTQGAQAVLKNQNGTTIATSTIDDGSTSDVQGSMNLPGGLTFDCTWAINFTDVPAATFYEVDVAGHVLASIPRSTAISNSDSPIVDATPS